MTTRATALAYLRVSGKGQVGGHGFTRQRQAIQQYARSAKLDLVAEYKDAKSGTKELADRAGLAALLDHLQSDGVKVVLVERADRLARDLMVSEVLLGQFRDLGVTVIAADSGTDLTVGDNDPTRKLIRQVLGAVAEFDKSVIVLKLRAARDRIRRQTGRCEGPKPFGDKPGEADTLARIRQLRRKPRGGKRLSVAKIADRLNAEGRPTRGGNPWKPGSVYAILKRL